MKNNLIRKSELLLVIVLALSITACSFADKSFTLNTIKTEYAGFAGISSSGISASNIYLRGEIGSKTYEIQLSEAFDGYTIYSVTGKYEDSSITAFNPEIASLSLTLKDSEDNIVEISMSPGDTFKVEIQDDKAVILLDEDGSK